jgi:polyisoprenoid-binding protein YceI
MARLSTGHAACYGRGMRPFQQALLVVALAVPAMAVPSYAPSAVAGTFAVTFSGTSTLHDFEGSAAVQRVEARRLAGRDAWTAEVRVPVATLDTGSAWRNANMRSMFDAERFPDVTAVFEMIDPSRSRPAGPDRAGSLPFTLRIRDVAHEVVGATSVWREEPDRLSFDVRFEVSLASFGLEPPSALGVIEVGDVVTVSVHVNLEAAG